MAFDKIITSQAVSAAKEGIKLERALDVLREKRGQNDTPLMPKELLSSEAILKNQKHY